MKNLAALAAVVLTLAGAEVRGAVKVELLKESSVACGVVRLKDVALVEGEGSAALQSLIVCLSPAGGESLSLAAERVRQRVAAVLGEAEVTMAGAASCRVKRSAAPQDSPTGAGTAAAPAAVKAGKAGTLEAAIRQFVLERLAPAAVGGGARLEFDARDREALDLMDERWQFKLISGTGQFEAGSAMVRAEIYERSKPHLVARSARIQFHVVLAADVVVVARNLSAGDVLSADDVRLERREFREPQRGLLVREVTDAVGATARSALAAGRLLRPEDLTKTLMVQRGDAVTVYVRGGGFTIKTVCRALESGERGSTVAVQGQDGSGKFYATVIGPRTVELSLGAGEGEGERAAQPAARTGPAHDAACAAGRAHDAVCAAGQAEERRTP